MSNKYYETISKIEVSQEFKKKLIANLEKESEVKYKKEGMLMKVKRTIIIIISTLAVLLGSGVAYAALGGTINGVPVLEWMGIKFSDDYVDYVEPIENQILENDEAKVTLESTVCDEGFTILQFRVNISEKVIEKHKEDDSDFIVNLNCLSFNDPVYYTDGHQETRLNGSNYNLIIDGEEMWVRGSTAQSMERLSDTEYLVYQMYFLTEQHIGDKKEFEITLNDVALGIGEDWIEIDGSFNVKLSKERASNDTKIITPETNTTLKYKKMEKSIEKIYITPLQNIVKLKTVYKDVDLDDLTYSLDDDYVGTIDYLAFNQNENNISAYSTETERKITYEDGTVEESEPGEFEFERDEFEHATYEIIEYIAIEQNEEINQIDIKAYERSDTDESIKNIMEYKIDLNTNKIEAENKDVLIYDPKNSIITDEYKIYYKVFYGVEYDEAEYYHNKEDENHETEIDEELEISKDGKETEVSEETEKNLLEEKVTNNSMVAYAVNSRNESHAIIKATKNGKTISKEVEMNGLVDKAETIEIPTIGKVLLVSDTAGESYVVNIYQLINNEIVNIGNIDCDIDMVTDATYTVETKNDTIAIINAKLDNETVKQEFEMSAEIAYTKIIDIFDLGKVVLVAETGGEYYGIRVYRLSQEYTSGKIQGIIEAGFIQYINE